MEMYDEVIEVKKKSKAENRGNTNKGGVSRPVIEPVVDDSERTTTKRPTSSLPRKNTKPTERLTSESESSDTGTDDAKATLDGFDYRQWESVDVPPEIKDLYQYIARLNFSKNTTYQRKTDH